MASDSYKYKDIKIAKVENELEYTEIYNSSIDNPDIFWAEIAERISWDKNG